MIDARQRRVGFLVAGCFFMEIMDGTIVSTAAPRLSEALRVPVSSIGLLITAYFVTLAVLIPSSGWLVSRWGTRKVFLSAIVVFTAASLLCSTSTSLGELAAFRVLQGAGAAMMTPVGRLSVLARTAKSDLMRMISYIVWPALLAPVIAPLAGGVITTYGSWRWIFLINVPLGVVAFVVAVRIVPAVPPSAPPPLDLAGVALTALGLGGLAYAAGLISQSATPWALVAAVGLPALIALALAIRHLLRAKNPLVDLRTLRIATFRVSVGSGALSTMAIAAVPFMLALLFQNVFGWSPVKSGAVVLFVFVVMLLNAGEEERTHGSRIAYIAGIPGAAAIFCLLSFVFLKNKTALGTTQLGGTSIKPGVSARMVLAAWWIATLAHALGAFYLTRSTCRGFDSRVGRPVRSRRDAFTGT